MKWLPCALLALPLVLATPAVRADDKLEETPYYPLQVGTTWHYKVGDGKFIMKVTKHEMVGKELCARIVVQRDGQDSPGEDIAVKKDGVYRYSFNNLKPTMPVLILKLPPKKGDTWTVDVKTGANEDSGTVKGKFIAGEEKIKIKLMGKESEVETVTASSDDLEADGLRIKCKCYFAKDLGMVKQEIDVANQKIVIELEKFEAGKK
jgi:hypothetical protein